MEFSIKSKQLEEELSRIVGVTGKQQPALSYVRIEANGSLKMSATDLRERLDLFVEGATIQKPGLVCLPAKRLCELAKLMNADEEVLLREKSDGKVEIRQGKTKYNLSTISPGAFPNGSDEFDTFSYLIPNAAAFRKMIRLTSGFIGEDDSRFAFSGAQIELDKGVLKIAATDGQRLAYAEKTFNQAVNLGSKPLKVLVPQKALQQLSKLLLAAEDEPVEIRLSRNAAGIPTKARFETGTRKLTANLTTGQFPNYAPMLSVNYRFRIETNTDQFASSMKRLRQVLDERTNLALFEIGRTALRMSSVARDVGDGFEEIPILHVGDEKPERIETIGANVEFFLDFLAAAKEIAPKEGAKVSVSYSGELAPVELGIPGATASFRYVFAPLDYKKQAGQI